MGARSWRPRAAITLVFFLNGAVFSSWYARLPAIQAHLHLSSAEVGLALAGAPAGLLLAQPLVGAVVARRGSRPLVAAAPLYCAAVVLPALATNVGTLLLAVTVAGASNGVLDISMNAQGLAVERAGRRRLFSSLHAGFSFGALLGASVAGAAASRGVAPLPHLVATASVGAAAALVAAPFLIDDSHDTGTAGRTRLLARPSRNLAVLSVIAFSALLAEGAAFDWSGIFLVRDAGAGQGLAAFGLAAFSLGMGAGRLAGDGAAERWGSAATARTGAAVAAAGLALALVLDAPAASILSFGVMGLGLSAVFPLALRAAATRGGAPALAAVSTTGYLGILAGPPVLGLVAQGVGLRLALVLVCGLCVLAAVLSDRLAEVPVSASRSAR